MKRFLFFSALVVFLFVLSSCYSYSDLQEELDKKDEEWSEQYYDLEEKYDEARDHIDHLESLVSTISEAHTKVYLYYYDHDSDVTEEEARTSLDMIDNSLRDAGY